MDHPSAKPKLDSHDAEQAAGVQSADARDLKDDPRDMFFTLPNWSDIWENTPKGSSIYTSSYPGGIFKTEEGYEFELRIYPKVQDSMDKLHYTKYNCLYNTVLRNLIRDQKLQLMQFLFTLTKSKAKMMN